MSAPAAVNTPVAVRKRVLGRRFRWPGAVVAVAVLATASLVLVAVFGSLLAPHDPHAQNLLLSANRPSPEHLLGTDALGRDVLSLVLAGGRTALIGPAIVAITTVLIGASLGILAGFSGGWIDSVISRVTDLMYALPGLLVAIVTIGLLGGGYWLAVAVLAFLSLPVQIRLCRMATHVQVRLPYIEAARALGVPRSRIMARHVLPNIGPIILATCLLDFVGALVGLAGLAYLGLGVPPGTPDWGSLIAEGQALLSVNPWLAVAPAVMLMVTATSITILGDWIYDQLTESKETT